MPTCWPRSGAEMAEGMFSVWLMPVAEDERLLAGIVAELAQSFGTPRFQPHLTLVEDRLCEEGDLVGQLVAVAAGIAPFAADIQAVGTSDLFFRAFYARFERVGPVLELKPVPSPRSRPLPSKASCRMSRWPTASKTGRSSRQRPGRLRRILPGGPSVSTGSRWFGRHKAFRSRIGRRGQSFRLVDRAGVIADVAHQIGLSAWRLNKGFAASKAALGNARIADASKGRCSK